MSGVDLIQQAAWEAVEWLESRPDYTEGDAATASTLRAALVGTMDCVLRCDDCGLDLSLSEFQVEAMRRRGNPVLRPACPARPNGAHHVSREQLERVAAAVRRGMRS